MLKNVNHITKPLSILLVLYGAAKIFLGVKSLWFAITYIFYSSSITFLSVLYALGLPLIYIVLIPVGAISGGFGLYQKKKWGWVLSISISLIIFTLHFAGTVNFIIASYFYGNIPLQPIPEGLQLQYSSMIPTYITTVVSLICILILRQKAVKNEFIKAHRGA